MKNILKYLSKYKKETILGPIFKLLEAIFDLLIPIIVSLIIDNGILKENNAYVIKMCLLLIMLSILGVIVAIIAQYFAAKVSAYLGSILRENLFKHVQTFSFKELDRIGESTIINRITNDTLQIQNGVNLFLRLALRSPLIVLGSAIMALLINVKIGIIFIAIIPAISLIIYFISKICVPHYNKIQEEKDELLKSTGELLTGTRVIRAFGIEEEHYNEFVTKNEHYTRLQKRVSAISSSMNSLNYVVINLGIILILSIGGNQVNNGIISQGQVVALYNYMAQILIELVKLTNLLLILPKMFASSKRINEIFDINTSMENGEIEIEKDDINMEFENVTLKYSSNGKPALMNISFQAKTGETIGIIGGTGSGKTSIINLIPRFYDVTSGEIKINSVNIQKYNLQDLRKNIGIVMQNKVLFKGTIKENIEFGNRNLTEREIAEALKISQSQDIIKNKARGIEEIVEEGGKNFSGGQRQRLTIARVIARNPKILIFDDSMSALDLSTDRKLREEIDKIKEDKIVIMVSQRISTIKNLDKILVIDNGRIVAQGKHEELMNNCEIYQEIYKSQLKKEEI